MPIDASPPDDSYDSNIAYLIDTLPTFMANAESSGNWKLYTPVANQIDALEDDLVDVDRATAVQTADTIAQLEALARMVSLPHEAGESKEHYRARLFARYQQNTAEGNAGDLLHSVATILDTDVTNIGYQSLSQDGTVGITMPGAKVDNLNLKSGEIAEILNDLVPAGYEVEAQRRGTFTYLSPADYTGGDPYDPAALGSDASKGHDGLDSDGDPKNNGGTYAGIIN